MVARKADSHDLAAVDRTTPPAPGVPRITATAPPPTASVRIELFDERGAGLYVGGTDCPISPRTMQRWRQQGTGPRFLRVGNLVRYRRADLDQWLSTRIARCTADRIGEPDRKRRNLPRPIPLTEPPIDHPGGGAGAAPATGGGRAVPPIPQSEPQGEIGYTSAALSSSSRLRPGRPELTMGPRGGMGGAAVVRAGPVSR
jgi:hypothetical protein